MTTFWHIDGRIMNRSQLDEWKRKKEEQKTEIKTETKIETDIKPKNDISEKTLDELRQMAKEKKIKGFGIMKKDTLIKFLTQ